MNWFALYSTIAGEFRALADLQARHFEVYLPQAVRIRTIRGQRQEHQVPLMPRYLFVFMQDFNRLEELFNVPTVIEILPHQREPIPVPAYQVENLKRRQSCGEFRVSDSPAGKRKLRIAKLRSFKELALHMGYDNAR